MKIGVYLTCQGKFFETLAETDEFNIEVHSYPNYVLFEQKRPFPDVWKDVDAFIYQPILDPPSDYYQDNNLLDNFVSRNAVRIRLPYVMYTGIFPWYQKSALPGMQTQYGNSWIENDVEKYITGEKTFNDILYAEDQNIRDWHEMSLQLLREKEGQSDVTGFSDFIEANFQASSLFWTPNHPRGQLAHLLCAETFRLLGLPKISESLIPLLDTVLSPERLPVLPCVARELGIKRNNDLSYFEGDEIPMTTEQYVKQYIARRKSLQR